MDWQFYFCPCGASYISRPGTPYSKRCYFCGRNMKLKRVRVARIK